MAFIGESERRHLNALYEKSRTRQASLTSSSSSSRESSETRRRRTIKLRKQSSPAYLPSITVTRHASFAPNPQRSYDEEAVHHQRANSVRSTVSTSKGPTATVTTVNGAPKGRQSRRTSARVSITELPPEFRPRSSTLPRDTDADPEDGGNDVREPEEDENVYRRRNFDVSPKGKVTNHGDCYRPRSNSSINTVGISTPEREYVPVKKDRLLSVSSSMCSGGNGERRLSLGNTEQPRRMSLLSVEPDSPPATPNTQYRVLICGAADVGKTAMINQFLSSEHTNVYEYNKVDGVRLDKTVSILLDGQESDLHLVDISSLDYGDTLSEGPPADAYLLIYNVTDRASFESAIDNLYDLKQSEYTRDKAIILVGNKTDLVRARDVTDEEGKSVAVSYDCKFIETSAALSDHVDELLVGILKQIRLKESLSPSKTKHKKVKYRKHGKDRSKFTHTYEKACTLLTKLLTKNSSKSCGNLYVL